MVHGYPPTPPAPPTEAVDQLVESHTQWREACTEVHEAYERFSEASRADRPAAFAAYFAALDREQQAATTYREQVQYVALRTAMQPWRHAPLVAQHQQLWARRGCRARFIT
jgi:hypothetical protein